LGDNGKNFLFPEHVFDGPKKAIGKSKKWYGINDT
jgi:hypothetical protein